MRNSTMRLPLLVLVSVFAAGSPLLADNIPYPTPGQLAPNVTLTAAVTGTEIGYFVSASATDSDKIEMWDVTQNTFSGFLLPNHSSAVGTAANFGSVNAGDTLVFIIDNLTTGQMFDSVNNHGVATTYSADGYNHAYATAYTGGISGIPISSGTYIGMEDLPVDSLKPLTGTDLDYNDDTFVFTDVASKSSLASTPEPGTFVLLGTGLLGAAGTLRRKFTR
jgi:PEP-CTERM motif